MKGNIWQDLHDILVHWITTPKNLRRVTAMKAIKNRSQANIPGGRVRKVSTLGLTFDIKLAVGLGINSTMAIKTQKQLKDLINPDQVIINIHPDGVSFYDINTGKFLNYRVYAQDIPDPFAWPEIIKLAGNAKNNNIPNINVSQIWDILQEVLEPC
jgi:hypothetical protein